VGWVSNPQARVCTRLHWPHLTHFSPHTSLTTHISHYTHLSLHTSLTTTLDPCLFNSHRSPCAAQYLKYRLGFLQMNTSAIETRHDSYAKTTPYFWLSQSTALQDSRTRLSPYGSSRQYRMKTCVSKLRARTWQYMEELSEACFLTTVNVRAMSPPLYIAQLPT
jgi:hypothetical protein